MFHIKNNFFMKITSIAIMIISFKAEPAKAADKLIHFKTSDANDVAVKDWQIKRMSILSSLAREQKTNNSSSNPIEALFITKNDLLSVANALDLDWSNPDIRDYYATSNLVYQAKKVGAFDIIIKMVIFSPKLAENPKDLSATTRTIYLNVIRHYLNNKCLEKRKINLIGHPETVQSIVFNPLDKQWISASSGYPNNLIAWKINNLADIQKTVIPNKLSDIYSIGINATGDTLVIGGNGYKKIMIGKKDTQGQFIFENLPYDFPGTITSIALLPSQDLSFMVTASKNNNGWTFLNLKDLSDIKAANFAEKSIVQSIAWLGSKIVVGGTNNNLSLWTIHEKTFEKTSVPQVPKNVLSVATHPNGNCMAAGGYDDNGKNLMFYTNLSEPFSANNMVSLKGYSSSEIVRCIAFSKKGDKMVTGSDGKSNNLIIWNLNSSIEDKADIPIAETILSFPTGVSSVAFSSDDKQIAVGSFGGKNNLTLINYLSDEEIIESLKFDSSKETSFAYELCLEALSKNIQLAETSDNGKLFKALPATLQNLLKELFDVTVEASPSNIPLKPTTKQPEEPKIILEKRPGQYPSSIAGEKSAISSEPTYPTYIPPKEDLRQTAAQAAENSSKPSSGPSESTAQKTATPNFLLAAASSLVKGALNIAHFIASTIGSIFNSIFRR